MAITWTETLRKAVSRRLVKLPQEIVVLNEAVDNVDLAETAFTDVEAANQQFCYEWIGICNAYIGDSSGGVTGERNALQGYVCNGFTSGESDDPYAPAGKFFQLAIPPAPPVLGDNLYLNPSINQYTNGVRQSWATNCEEWIARTYQSLARSIRYGLGGGGVPVNTPTSTGITGATTVLTVTSSTGITAGMVVLVFGTLAAVAHQHVFYVVEATNATTLQVVSIGGSNLDAGTCTVHAVMAANTPWNNDFPIGGAYVDSENAIQTYMNNIAPWSTYMNNENIELLKNNDIREPQATQNAEAIVDTNIATAPIIISGLPTWFATGPVNRYLNLALDDLITAVGLRITEIDARISQLRIAVGAVSGSGGTFSLITGAIASRYHWLDARSNKGYGSMAQQDNMTATKQIMEQRRASSVIDEADYNTVMRAEPLVVEPDGTNSVYVSDGISFSSGDPVYVRDELDTNLELSGTISWVTETTDSDDEVVYRIDLSFDVSADYTLDSLVRVYKVL